MSGEKASSPCGKFQANFFNKSKCQNCFKSRELHLLGERDLDQVKPVYGGWLCLAPEGTDFNNPVQRSRKWQRRFFILYEDGSLSFALDELPSTLPQGTLSLTLCTDIADAEPRTGQRNALCLITPQQEIFIRGDNKEIINGWSEQLAVYLQTSAQSQKQKHKVEPGATQEPSPAKISATDLGFPSMDGDCGEQDGGADDTPVWTVTDPRGIPRTHRSTESPSPDGVPGEASLKGPDDSNADGNPTLDGSCSAERLHGSVAPKNEQPGGAASSRLGRGEARSSTREKLQSCRDVSRLTAAPPARRSRSLDRRTSDSIMTPDLLNFKKGWMVKLDEDDQWKKSWFVLSTDSLRYYRDSVAEEASDLEGEIDLTKCFGVSECHVQRNYGFQIHTQKGVFTLSAMTAGIRKNWIQALMKNVHPANAPDVTSLPGHLVLSRTPEVLPRPDVTRDSPCSAPLSDPQPRTVADKRRDGRYRTFDWAEFRPRGEPVPPLDPPSSSSTLELLDAERRRRREERRRRYENMLGFSLGYQEAGGGVPGMEEEMEECWKLVEKMMFRPEKTVPLTMDRRDETVLQSCRQAVEDLKVQLAESQRCRLMLEAQLSAAGFQQQSRSQSRELVSPELEEEPPSPPQPPGVWLQDTQGNLQEALSSGDQHQMNSDLQGQKDEDVLQQSEILEMGDDSSHLVEVKRLSREVELLAGKNEALNQRNQEMLNQLTEADREIERLKAELSSRYSKPRLLPEAEQQEKTRLEVLEVELNLRNQELLESRALVASLEDNLREALQQQADTKDGADKAEGYLLRCFEATEAKLTELETQLRQSEQQKVQLREAEELHRHRAAEAEANVRRLRDELELERTGHGEGKGGVSGEERIQQVMEVMAARQRTLGRLLEVMETSDLVTEEQFRSLLKDPADELLSEEVQQMMVERQMLLLLSDRDHFQDFQETIESSENVTTSQHESGSFTLEKNHLQCVTQMKISLLSRLLSSVTSSTSSSHLHQMQLAMDRLCDSYSPRPRSSTSFLHSAATEALCFCRLLELQAGPQRCGRLTWPSSDASCQTEEDRLGEEVEQEEQQKVEPEFSGMETQQHLQEHYGPSPNLLVSEATGLQEKDDLHVDQQEEEPELSRMETQQNFKELHESDPNLLVPEQRETLVDLQEDKQKDLHAVEQDNLREEQDDLHVVWQESDHTRMGNQQEDQQELKELDQPDSNIMILELTELQEDPQEDQQENQHKNQQENQQEDQHKNQQENQQEDQHKNQQENQQEDQHKNQEEDQHKNQQENKQEDQQEDQHKNQQMNQQENQQEDQQKNQQEDQHKNQQEDQQENQQELKELDQPDSNVMILELTELQENQQENQQESQQEDQQENQQQYQQENQQENQPEEKQENQRENQHKNHQEDEHKNQQEDQQENQQNNQQENQPEEKQKNLQENQQEDQQEQKHENQQENQKENQQVYQYEDRYKDQNEDQCEDQCEDQNEDQCEDQNEDQYDDQYIDQHEDQYEDQYEDGPELSRMETQQDLKDPVVLVSELKELQQQMSQLKQALEAELSGVRAEHQKEMDNLKATCQRGFSTMEEAQMKVVEELQRRHRREVERLLVERDRLLEEESSATATAIEAIKNAHRLDLQRELERRERRSGETHLEDIYQQHSEELASYQRELEVLSQQFSLKCLENVHLVQAVDAERKALCQCQQENQDLRTRNQELSGNLAAEITRLCSLAEQDALPLSQGMDLYEMEITLRVKESEVQYLKEEITSLKEELQSAQKDKRNATKKYKDVFTELSMVRARALRDADQLRENLRLARQALGQSSL